MNKIAATSGGLGDIVYSIPILRELNVRVVYVKENWFKHPNHSLYSAIKPLLEWEGFEVRPTRGGFKEMEYEPGLKFDYDLDSFRKLPGRGIIHIQTLMRQRFKLPKKELGEPWLLNRYDWPGKVFLSPYSVIQLTPRWRDNSHVDWRKVFATIPTDNILFLGFQEEWEEFCKRYGRVEWYRTKSILDMAHIISQCEALYCNQSVGLTIAQGLGKQYFLEKKPNKTNCLMYTKNETLL